MADILINTGKIIKIEPDISTDNKTDVFDATGLKVFPGFIDAYSHLGLDGWGTRFDAGISVKNGMDAYEALKAITINPAKHIGIEDKVGSLKEGKDADIVIADGNPMDISTQIIQTFINGIAVKSIKKSHL